MSQPLFLVRTKEWMTRPRVLQVMEGITGLVLLGLGINLAFTAN
ncbi:hypothetical protein AA0X95_25885 [Bacillus sp. 1P10SD]